MAPAVRSPWIEFAIITDRARNVAFGLPNPKNSRQPTGIWPSKTLPRGTEFLDAETVGQNRPERPQELPETERAGRYRRKSPQKRAVLSRPGNRQFGRTVWWCAQSDTNRSPCYLANIRVIFENNSELATKRVKKTCGTGISLILRQFDIREKQGAPNFYNTER